MRNSTTTLRINHGKTFWAILSFFVLFAVGDILAQVQVPFTQRTSM